VSGVEINPEKSSCGANSTMTIWWTRRGKFNPDNMVDKVGQIQP